MSWELQGASFYFADKEELDKKDRRQQGPGSTEECMERLVRTEVADQEELPEDPSLTTGNNTARLTTTG